MKSFIKNLLGFSLFIIVLLTLVNIVFLTVIRKTDWDFRRRIESLRFRNPEFELLVLGHSLAADGIDTEYLTKTGIPSYNLSIGGSYPKSNLIQLDEYLSLYSTKPRVIILGLASYMGRFDVENIHPIIEFTQKGHKYTLKDIPIVKFQWLGIQFLKKLVSDIHRDVELSYGQLRSPKISPDHTTYNSIKFSPDVYTSSTYIREIAELCTVNNIELVLIEMPGFKNTQNDSDVGPYQIDFGKGISYHLFNLNSISFCKIFDSERDWIANSHLNKYGANKFTRSMVDTLKNKGYPLF